MEEFDNAPAKSREIKARVKFGERPKRKVPRAPDMRPDSTISFRPYLSARCLCHAFRSEKPMMREACPSPFKARE
jgi:hypothetical protein